VDVGAGVFVGVSGVGVAGMDVGVAGAGVGVSVGIGVGGGWIVGAAVLVAVGMGNTVEPPVQATRKMLVIVTKISGGMCEEFIESHPCFQERLQVFYHTSQHRT